MKQLPDYLINDLIRHLHILIENVDTSGKSTRVYNAVRLAKNDLKKLTKINSQK